MRPSRSVLTFAALAAVPATIAAGVLGGGSSSAAPKVAPSAVAAPVAQAPKVVAHAVVAPKKDAAAAPHVAPTRRATRTTKPVVKTAAPKPAAPKPAAAPQPVAPKPAAPRPVTTTTSSTPTGNDYPYANAAGNEVDKWGFTERQCVSFAAWRLARAGRAINNAQGWGSAYNWDDNARTLGIRVSTTPHVGAIAQWNVGESSKVFMNGGTGTFTAGEYGHVGYVAAVYSDGSALIEQYNAQGDRQYSVLRMTAPRYLF